jgi:hypothetical protein
LVQDRNPDSCLGLLGGEAACAHIRSINALYRPIVVSTSERWP